MYNKRMSTQEKLNLIRASQQEINLLAFCSNHQISINILFRLKKQHEGIKLGRVNEFEELTAEKDRLQFELQTLESDVASLHQKFKAINLTIPEKRSLVDVLTNKYDISIRQACKILSLRRASYTYQPHIPISIENNGCH